MASVISVCALVAMRLLTSSAGLWSSLLRYAQGLGLHYFVYLTVPKSFGSTQSLQSILLCMAKRMYLFCCCSTCCYYGWKLPSSTSNTWKLVFIQISVLSVFLWRGPQTHWGVWLSPLFRHKELVEFLFFEYHTGDLSQSPLNLTESLMRLR